MKKSGFTIIETIISLFIILILCSGVASIGNLETNIYKDIENEGFMYEIHDFLTLVKSKCKVESTPGNIIVDPIKNRINYSYGNFEDSRFISMPSGIKIQNKTVSIPIDLSGRFNKACSIEIKNYFNELKSVKIRVGVDYINLNDDYY